MLSFGSTVRRHTAYGGFRAFGAINLRGRLVGFSYGYTSQPGLWWREQIATPLTPEQRRFWLTDAFELAELHVHPTAQGHHLGSQLHDRLLETQQHSRALLSVMHRSTRARQLYASRGWQTVLEDVRFSTEPRTGFSLLGLTLADFQAAQEVDQRGRVLRCQASAIGGHVPPAVQDPPG